MFGMDPAIVAIVTLAALSVGGVAYALLYGRIQKEDTTRKRLHDVQRADTDPLAQRSSRDRQVDGAKRRKQIQDSLSELEARQKARERNTYKPPLKVQLKQAGLSLPIERFDLISAVFGLLLTGAAWMLGLPVLGLPAVLIVGVLGMPRWVVAFLRKRRVKQFLLEFPNALDIIVRAVKSGLPLNDGVRLIASEAREPVRSEFRRIVEAQQLGLTIPEAAMRMTETMPCPEAGFFGIVIQIQSQAGGNLSEALGNLSRVLRDRKKMKDKIAALSMEAKASAVIIASLPFAVASMVYLTTPDYIMPLFTETTGHIILGCSAVWMSIGIWIMRNMMNFEV